MKVLISEIPKEGYELEFSATVKGDSFISPTKARLMIKKTGTEITIKGNLRADVELQCSRCLKDFKNVLHIPVNAVYQPVEELKVEEIHELKGEELDTAFYSVGELDILDILREQIILSIPMKPLCNDLCKGICTKCGADLNSGECGCSIKKIDSRLEVLKKIFAPR